MSKSTRRDTARPTADTVEERLARLLDAPGLARIVPHLPAETLHQLVRHRGLDACGELVTAATPAQLTALLDLDLWRQAPPGRPGKPGSDERFDVDRFGEWIEMLVDTGAGVAARTVAALDAGLVTTGLSRYVRVFDPGIFEPTAQSDDEMSDRHEAMREGEAGDVALECEVGGYFLRARRIDVWDAIVALLGELADEHGDYFTTVMQGCRGLSNSRPEVDGLDDLLMAPEQQLHDAAIEREHRRSRQGYATPADARAFLEMARRTEPAPGAAAGANPIVTAYFRAADEAQEPPADAAPASARLDDRSTGAAPESLEAVMELLTEAGVLPMQPRALLAAGDADPQASRLAHLLRLMTHVRDSHEPAYFARSRELAFLANTLLAGCPVQSRAFTPQEASDAAAAVCNLGLDCWPDGLVESSFLVDHDLVTAFEVGWSILYRDVCLFAADRLSSTLATVDCVDRDVRRELAALRRTLVTQRKAGTPWRARGAAEILAMLDPTVWVGVLGLLAECPVVPAALTAVVDGRTARVSPTAFEFISTSAQIGVVRRFLDKLPELLSR